MGVTTSEGCTAKNPILVPSVTTVIILGLKPETVVAKVNANYVNGSLVIPPLQYMIIKVSIATDDVDRRRPRERGHRDGKAKDDRHLKNVDGFFKIDKYTGNIAIAGLFNFTDGVDYILEILVSDSGNSSIGAITNPHGRVRLLCRDVCKNSKVFYNVISQLCPRINITRQVNGDNSSILIMRSDDFKAIYGFGLNRDFATGNYTLQIKSANVTLLVRFRCIQTALGKQIVIKGHLIDVHSDTLEIKLFKDLDDVLQSFTSAESVTIVGVPRDINCSVVNKQCLRAVSKWKREAEGSTESLCMQEDPELLYMRYGHCIGAANVSIVLDKSPTAADQSVTLRCRVTSAINNTIRWYHNGKPIPGIADKVYTFTATVYKQGYYTCEAVSAAGTRAVRADNVLLKVPDYFTSYVFFKSTKRGQSVDGLSSEIQKYLSSQVPNKYFVKANDRSMMEFAVYGKIEANEYVVKYHETLKSLLLRGASDQLKGLRIKKSTLTVRSAEYCLPETTGKANIQGKFEWNLTKTGEWSHAIPCPYNNGNSARRRCNGTFDTGGVWNIPEDGRCNYASKRTQKLKDISKRKINRDNAKQTAEQLKNLTSQTPGKDMNEADAALVADILENLVGNQETLNETGRVIVEVVNEVMNMDEKTLANSQEASSKIIKALDTLVGTMPMSEGESSLRLGSKSLTLQLNQVNLGSFNGLSFDKDKSGSVKLPSVLFENSSPGSNRVGFIHYVNNKLFQVNENNDLEDDEDTKGYQTSNVVMSSSVYNTTIRNLQKPLVLTFPKPKGNLVPKKCVFWEETLRIWSSEGCKLTESGSCECNHMTSFAAIFSPPGQVPRSADDPLTIISYVGCAISLAGVLLTLLTFSLFRHLRKTNQQAIIINLCIALGLLLIVFLAGASRPYPRLGCQIVAVLMHYLSLAVVMWMGVEGYNLYQQIVQVMATYQRKFMLKVSVVAWGVPAIIVAVTATVAAVEHKKMPDSMYYYGNETVCILYKPMYYWVAWFAPILLILTVNVIIYIMVVYKLSCTDAMVNPEKKSVQRYRFRTAFAIMFLLGLTWLFGALSFGNKYQRLVFEYLFCIFNSLQGLFIFVFHCARVKEVRAQWRFFFSGYGISHKGTTDSYQRSRGIGESHHSSEAPYAKVTTWITRKGSDRKRKETVSTIVGPNSVGVGDPKDVCDNDVHLELEAMKDNIGAEHSDSEKSKEAGCD